MTDLLTRAASWLVAPREEAGRQPTRWLAPTPPGDRLERADRPATASRLAVIGPPTDVLPLAASVALIACRHLRASTALAMVWPSPDEDVRSGAAAPTARLLAGRLRRRGFAARARGRLVWLPIAGEAGIDGAAIATPRPPDTGEAGIDGASIATPRRPDTGEVTTMGRAEAVAGHVPSVVAVTSPRDECVDAMLAGRDLVVVAAQPASALAGLALAELEAIGVRALAVTAPPPGLARIAALAGLRPHPFDDDDLVGVLG